MDGKHDNFLLAGLIIGHRVLDNVQMIDWVYLFVLYVMCQLSRYVVILTMYPVLANSGHKTNRKEAAFIAFAGLRGALGMALGLILVDEDVYLGIDETNANRLFFYVGGVVAMSLIFNGGLTSSVLRLLDLGSKDSVEQLLIMDQIKRKMRRKINKMVDHMQAELEIAPRDMMEIRMSCSILRPSQQVLDSFLDATTKTNRGITNVDANKRNSLTAHPGETDVRALTRNIEVDEESVSEKDTIGHDDGEFRDNYDANNGNNGLNDLVRDDSSTDSDISAAHKSFKRNIIDDSIQDPSLLLAVQDTSRGEGGATKRKRKKNEAKSKSKREKDELEHAEERAQFRAKARSRSPGPVRRRSFGAARRENASDDSGRTQAAGLFSEWMGEATGITGDRPRRYNTMDAEDRGYSVDRERQSRYRKLTEQLDPSRRDNKIFPEMLAHVRTVFLEIVRVKYWKLIEGGKLPRQNASTQFLLYSVDVGLDLAHMAQNKTILEMEMEMEEDENHDGLGDWHVIEKEIDHIPFGQRVLQFLENCLPSRCGGDVAGNLMEAREQKAEDNAVYMLTAFIEAHEHAQKKIHSFVGVEPYSEEDIMLSANHDTEVAKAASMSMASYNQSILNQISQLEDPADQDSFRPKRSNTDVSENSETLAQQTPEEIRVKAESARLVARAKEMLEMIEPEAIAAIKARQAAMTVLAREIELVKTMCEEGLLGNNQAEKLLEEITEDRYLLEWDRGNIFRRRQPHTRAPSTASGAPFSFMKGGRTPETFLSKSQGASYGGVWKGKE